MMGDGRMGKNNYNSRPKKSGNEEVWRARLMDKVDSVGSELRLIKYLSHNLLV